MQLHAGIVASGAQKSSLGGAAVFAHNLAMGDVRSIEKAVEALPPDELAQFRHWFAEFDAIAWERQIAQDAASGKLDLFVSEAMADYNAGPNPRKL